MEMHQVRYFLAVARTLNFTRAADECNVTQPSLTRAIQKLEDEFGGLLFRRERALTHLTDLGREMLPHLQRTYDAAQAARALAQEFGKAQVAPLSLGVQRSIATPVLSAVLGEVARQLAGLELRLVDGGFAELMEATLHGDLDFVIVERRDGAPDRFEAWELYRQPYRVALPAAHRLAAADSIRLGDLHAEPWIGSDEDGGEFGSLCGLAGVAPVIAHRVAGSASATPLVAAGLGCALVPDGPAAEGVVIRPLADADIGRTILLGAIAGRRRSVAAEAFVRAARARSWAG
jgi:DNA-binding transcriptional LysR family regulator